MRQWQLGAGREFRDGGLASEAAACIIGATVAEELFGDADPLERNVRMKSLVCKVIGVLEARRATLGMDQDDLLVMPLRTFQRRIAGDSDVNQILIAATSEDVIEQMKSEVVSVLRERRHLSSREEDDFTVMDQRERSSTLGTVMGILTGLLAAIAGISLLVDGIGIMNIVLVSVTERTREIGIRLAIGARESQVLMQFLVEAAALSTLGGLIGIALGLGIGAVAAPLLGVPFVANYWAAVGDRSR